MADYGGANVKVIINDLSAGADSVSGTIANIKTFVATLSNNTIISADVVKLDSSRVAYIILYIMANCQHCNEPNPEGMFNCPSCGKRAYQLEYSVCCKKN